MIASKFMDVVAGVDIHIQLVIVPPNPVPTLPTILPTPFMGLVFDPATVIVLALGDCKLATAICVAMDPIGAAVNYVVDKIEGVSGGPVHINDVPASTTMTEPMQITPHPPTPPGLLFLSSMTPVLKGNACYNMGSSSVWMAGRRAVRTGMDPTFSCSQPIRLPSSQTMPVPLGAPVLIGGFPTPDLQAMISRAVRKAITGQIKSRVGVQLKAMLQMLPDGRRRTILTALKCHATGDPVDVATGRMLATATDWELPGPIPIDFTREYSSVVSDRDGVLGFGWSHTLDEEVWVERGRVVYRAGDGREIQFDTIHLPGRQMRIGDEVFEPINRLWLRRTREGWDVANAEGRVHELRLVFGDRRTDRWRLSRIRSRDGHEIVLAYDERARLAWVRDSEARVIQFEHDRNDRLVCISLPHPTQPGFVPHVRYEYAPNGNLMAVQDALGNVARYDYSGHLMVQRTDRTGLSFYFGYDGLDASAWCVRTWGDGGIYDHTLVYDRDNRRTIVTNSLGASTVFDMNEALLVVKVTDPHGGTREYTYDDQMRVVLEVGPSGEKTETEYDARGNCVRVVQPGRGETRTEFDDRNLRTRELDAAGAEQRWEYDSLGRVIRAVDSLGHATTVEYAGGRPSAIHASPERVIRLTYDQQQRTETVILPNGHRMTRTLDALGRVIEERNGRGGVVRHRYSPVGDLDEVVDELGLVYQYRYDSEGNLLESREATRHVRYAYGHNHKVVAEERGGSRLTFEYDTEGQLVAVVNAAAERFEIARDAMGHVTTEMGFGGDTTMYLRDASGRIARTILPTGRASDRAYDAEGRLAEIRYSDGTSVSFAYDSAGRIVEATNESSHVMLKRDVLGRVTHESQDGGATWVRSGYGTTGTRNLLESDLGASQHVSFGPLGEIRELIHGSDAGSAALRFEHDALGLEQARELLGGVRVAWKRDVEGKPTERLTTRRRQSREGAVAARAADSESLDARAYKWRDARQLAGIVNAATGPTLFDHDDYGHLVRERRPAEHTSVARSADSVGNVYRSEARTDRIYRKGGRLEIADGVRYEHDADGNQIAKTDSEGRRWAYQWNGSGMLSEVSLPDGGSVRFEYDAFARRTTKRVVGTENGAQVIKRETRFVWDRDTVLHELDAEKGLTTWYWEPDTSTPVMKERDGKRWSVAVDHLGTPTEMYDEVGELAWKMQLDVFGVPRFDAGVANDCPWRWPGQYADEETGLLSNRWRYYDPHRGTYVSEDPISLMGGEALYGYVDDPTLTTDPDGLRPTIDSGGFFARSHEYQGGRNPSRSRVTIPLQGSRGRDFTQARIAAGLPRRPPGYTWHHVSYDPQTGMGVIQLVRTNIHGSIGHDGGVSFFEAEHGLRYDTDASVRFVLKRKLLRGRPPPACA